MRLMFIVKAVLVACLLALSGQILAATSTVRTFSTTSYSGGQCWLVPISVTDTCNITANAISCTRKATSSPQQCVGSIYGSASVTIGVGSLTDVAWLKDSQGYYVDGVVCAGSTVGQLCWQLAYNNSVNLAWPYFNALKVYNGTDTDADMVQDVADNCPTVANIGQADANANNVGDVCEPGSDADGDGVTYPADNCPVVANADQLDTDGDAQGNACDTDDDNDGVLDVNDRFPLNAAAAADDDNDGYPSSWNASCDTACQLASGLVLDNCPYNANPDQLNTDGDAQGNACDSDDDNDGVPDVSDAFPLDPAESLDTDHDGIGNNSDPDDDNDGVPDYLDPEPLNAANGSTWPLNGGYRGSQLREAQAVQ